MNVNFAKESLILLYRFIMSIMLKKAHETNEREEEILAVN
jgi:hypothetical protein